MSDDNTPPRQPMVPYEPEPPQPVVPPNSHARRGPRPAGQSRLWDTTGSIPKVEPAESLDALEPGTSWAHAPWDTTGSIPRVEIIESIVGVAPQAPPPPESVTEPPPVYQPAPPVEVTGPLPPVTSTGPLPRLDVTGSLPPVASTGPLPPVTSTGPLPRLDVTGPLPPVETTGPLPPVETTGQLSGLETVVLRAYDDDEPHEPEKTRTEHVARRRILPAGWFVRVCQCLVALAVVAGAAFGARYWPSDSPAPEPQAVSSHIDLMCQGLADLPGTLIGVTGETALWQGQTNLAGPVFTQAVAGASTLSGNGSLAGFVQFDQPGQSAVAACAQPTATGFLQLTNADDTLVLTNPDPVDAVISVYLMGPNGDITAAGLVDVTVPAASTVNVALSEYAAGVAPLGITWQSTIGRVVAYVVDQSAAGLDIITPTLDDTVVVVPAVTPGGTVTLLLTNPATVRTTATIEAITSQGIVPVVGGEQVAVEARSTMSLDVTAAIQDEPVALRVTSDKSVAATASVQAGTDIATIPGVPLSQQGRADLLGVVNGPGELVLTSNASKSVNITLTLTSATGSPTTTQLALDPGESTVVNMPGGLWSIRVHAGSGIMAALVIQPPGTDPSKPDASGGISIVRLPPDSAWHGVTPLWVEGQPPA